MSSQDRRRDPRAEPDDDVDPNPVERPFQREVPLSVAPATAALLPSESQVRAVSTPSPLSTGEEEMPSLPAPAAISSSPSTTSSSAPSSSVGPPLETIEHLLDQGQWQAIHDLLGPSERAAELSPHVALIFALAHLETHPEDTSHSVELAIRSTARAHALPESSAVVRVLAKRLIRKSPPNWRARPAPPKKISIILVLLALTLGGGGGFWLSTTNVRLPLPGILSR